MIVVISPLSTGLIAIFLFYFPTEGVLHFFHKLTLFTFSMDQETNLERNSSKVMELFYFFMLH